MQNEPNLPRWQCARQSIGKQEHPARAGGPRAGRAGFEETPDGVTTNGARVQNEPNFPLAAGECRRRNAQNKPNLRKGEMNVNMAL